jgi:hypothetical protein
LSPGSWDRDKQHYEEGNDETFHAAIFRLSALQVKIYLSQSGVYFAGSTIRDKAIHENTRTGVKLVLFRGSLLLTGGTLSQN